MKHLFSLTALVVLLLMVPRVGMAEELPPDLEAYIRGFSQDYFKITSSIFVSFTSQTGVTQGGFVFVDEAGDDFKMDVVKAPLRYYFSPPESRTRPFLKFSYGYARTSTSYPSSSLYPEDRDIRDRDRSRTHSISLTPGVKWEYMPGFFIEPTIGFAYSHIEYKYDYNTRFMRELVTHYPSLDRDLFNTTVDLYSVSPGLRHEIEYPLGPGILGFDLQYAYSYSKPWRSKSRFADFTVHSGFLGTTLDYELPTGLTLWDKDLAVKPFLARTDLFADFREGMEMNHFYEFGLGFILDVGDFGNLFSRISLSGSYINGEGLRGWKFGLNFI
ncbi:Solitary outer membrane autotransporter beta-barrel domain [Desulfonatronum lacustre]|uniref:Solitary outer membrane autotransporter beta-barrel domain n=1 Tax=Desulfonatronum lacustre TaxID=66849 RepID=UPI00048F110A|nr:Solitary outer membrane autotransporter beta-barrel domain [Desulfonatronum lacustre]